MKNTLIGSHKNKIIKIFGDFWLSPPHLVMPLSLSVRVNTKLVFSLTPGLLLRDNLLYVSQVTCHVSGVSRVCTCVSRRTRPAGRSRPCPGAAGSPRGPCGGSGPAAGGCKQIFFSVAKIFSQDATKYFSRTCAGPRCWCPRCRRSPAGGGRTAPACPTWL